MRDTITRDEAWALIQEYGCTENHIHHMLAVEAAMRFYAEELGGDLPPPHPLGPVGEGPRHLHRPDRLLEPASIRSTTSPVPRTTVRRVPGRSFLRPEIRPECSAAGERRRAPRPLSVIRRWTTRWSSRLRCLRM